MRTYIIRRLLLMIPAAFMVSMLVYLLVYLIPGSMVDMIAAVGGLEGVDKETWEAELGLDASLPVQYGRWLGVVPQKNGGFSGLFQGNFGVSWWKDMPVLDLMVGRMAVTFELGLMGFIIAQLIALPIGIYSALRQDKWGDYIGRSIAILAISIPGFWLATLVIVFPAIWWDYMPPIMLIKFTDDPLGNLRMFIIPSIVLGMAMSGGTMRMMRTMMLEVLRQDYIRTAWAKGLRERVVILRHAVKNALIPVITIVGLQLPIMIGGTVIIEEIFVLPGMGRLIVTALRNRDEPLITGLVFIFAIALMLIILMTDLAYAYLDPRIRYK